MASWLGRHHSVCDAKFVEKILNELHMECPYGKPPSKNRGESYTPLFARTGDHHILVFDVHLDLVMQEYCNQVAGKESI